MPLNTGMIVYETLCLVNGKKYIGQHICGRHCNQEYPCNYLGSGKALKNAFKKYGKDFFIRKILAYAKSEDELNELEQFHVTLIYCNRKDTYNLKEGGGSIGRHSEETKVVLSERATGRRHSRKYKQYMKTINIGRKHTKETIEKMRIAKRGKIVSSETRKKISESLKGLKISKKTRMKISKSLQEYHRLRKEKDAKSKI